MKEKLRALWKRMQALVLAGVTVWAVWATAGASTAAGAADALRKALPLQLLRWELSDFGKEDDLSGAAVLVLREAPMLLSARSEVMALWKQAEEEEAEAPMEQLPTVPIQEVAEDAKTAEDNGAPAKTLLPNSPEGYTVLGKTYISNSTDYNLNVTELQEMFDAELMPGDGPQILIIHTHGSEAYTPPEGEDVVWSGDYRTTDSRYNVVRVGDEMADVFSAAGIAVLHDRTLYDYPNYADAYDRSLAAIRSYLAQYPSIRFVLDVHRDAVADSEGRQYKVVAQAEEGKTAAQMTLVVGSDGGGLEHPKWKENLKLAVALQGEILRDHPSLMRPMLLRNSRYNQHATTGSLLLEAGAAGNSPEEAALAGRLFAEAMVEVLMARSK